MELRRDLLLGVGSLFALNVLVALVAIAVFSRMGPVMDRVVRENVTSIQVSKEMLSALAVAPDGPLADRERHRYLEALQRATANVTEPAEAEPLARLAALTDRVLAGDPDAKREAVTQLKLVASANYAAMHRADTEARRLGLAGAWFAVLVAGFALVLSVLAIRRLTQRLIVPVRELWATLEASRLGDTFRRCSASNPPAEIGRILTRVNEMLDLQTKPRPWTERRAQADHAVVLWALRKRPEPTFVVDDRGQIFAANGPAHALLGSGKGAEVRAALAEVGATGRPRETGLKVAVEAVPDGDVWVCTIEAQAAGA